MNLYEALFAPRNNAGTIGVEQRPAFISVKREAVVIGYRAWRVSVEDGVAILASVIVRDYHWPTRTAAVAHDPNGVHGIHAFKLLDSALWTYRRNHFTGPSWSRVFGEVALAGTIIEHDHGYRATHAYPTLLYYTPDVRALVQAVARAYGVEIARLPA